MFPLWILDSEEGASQVAGQCRTTDSHKCCAQEPADQHRRGSLSTEMWLFHIGDMTLEGEFRTGHISNWESQKYASRDTGVKAARE